MRTIKDLINKEKGRSALVVGTGSTIKEKKDAISSFIKKTNPFIVGVNNMTEFWVPDYHVWTNNNRFRTYGKNISPKSTLLLGSNISIKIINKVIGSMDYVVLERVDREDLPIKYENGVIYGYHRTAGCTSITIAHLLGAEEISVVGMDGHTLHNYEDVKSGVRDHHFYDENYTPYSSEIRIKKDKIVGGVLQSLEDYGINFKILTPTKYRRFYDSTRLHI